AMDKAVAVAGQPLRPFAAIVRTAALLTRWARSVQRTDPAIEPDIDPEFDPAGDLAGDPAGDLAVGRAKATSYQVMQLAQLLAAAVDLTAVQLAAASAANGQVTPDPATLVAAISARAKQFDGDSALVALVDRLPVPGVELACAAGSDDVLAGLYAATYQRGAAPAQAQAQTQAPGTTRVGPVCAALWSVLAAQARLLSTAPPPTDPPAVGELGFTALRETIRGCTDERAVATVLHNVDRRSASVHLGIAAALPSRLKYLRIAGSNVSPLSLPPTELAYDGPRFTAVGLVAHGDSLPARTKLAGSDLANFSAFLSQRWRANDWMWGRLDAAKSTVDMITSPGRMRATSDNLRTVEQLVTSPMPRSADVPEGWSKELDAATAQLWSVHRNEVARELVEELDSVADGRLTTTKRLLVLRRQWEILTEELPIVLRSPLRPVQATESSTANVDDLPPTVSDAIDAYQRSPRAFGDVWGMRWSTALGIRTAYEFWAATRPTALWKRAARSPLKPLPMSILGSLLARNRGLLALALAFNFVLLPRLHGGGAWTVLVVGVVGTFALGKLYTTRNNRGRITPLERFGRLYQLGAALSFVVGATILTSSRLHHWLYGLPSDTVLTTFNRHLVNPYVLLSAATTFVSTALLWCWARWRWRLLAAASVGVVAAFWAVLSRMQHRPDASRWTLLGFAFASMAWAAVVALTLTTTIAHLAFRQNWRIAEFDRD
ncbi:MAG: DUF3376 domain-containing protein, partial [Ilumatobacteraceae bacterium]